MNFGQELRRIRESRKLSQRAAAAILGVSYGIVAGYGEEPRRLFAVARSRAMEVSLKEGLGRAKVAAIGPIVTAALRERGVDIDIVPEEPFVMKRMTAAIAAALAR